MFDEVNGMVSSAKTSFSECVRDSFGESICNELFDELLKSIDFSKTCSDAAELKENIVRAMLIELRLII